eukprot:3062364-Amphidinium_carterae.1
MHKMLHVSSVAYNAYNLQASKQGPAECQTVQSEPSVRTPRSQAAPPSQQPFYASSHCGQASQVSVLPGLPLPIPCVLNCNQWGLAQIGTTALAFFSLYSQLSTSFAFAKRNVR